jgi:hypothetical protein
MDIVATGISAAAFFGLTSVLLLIGVVSGLRTRGLRRGRPEGRAPPGSWVSSPTSRLTWVAAWAGASAAMWGVTVTGGNGLAGLALMVGGAFVVLTGARGRVTSIEADGEALTIRSARGRPFALAWADVVVLRPPRTPLGGWRVQGKTGARTLMPSDLWGSEAVLALVTRSAGLRFDGRRWLKG